MAKLAENEDDSDNLETPRTSPSHRPNLKGDRLNLCLLMILYTLQGLSLGLSTGLPYIFQSKKNVTYEEQAFFSIVKLPYSMKLLWAPIVDALYVQWIGKRKSWLVPVQYIMGSFFLYVASNIDDWLPESGKPNIKALTYIFFVLNLLSATQDVVVDGWALTMLKKNNVSYGPACNLTGFSFGIFIGSVCFNLLTSKEFCDQYLRSAPGTGGLTTMKSFFFFWGFVFMLITTLVGVFKREKDNRLEENYIKINVFQNYKLLWDVLKLPSVKLLTLAMLTLRVGFAATYGVSNLKLMDAGISKDNITMLSSVLTAVHIIIPFIVSKYTSGPKPLTVCLKTMFIKLLWSLTYVFLVYYTPKMIQVNKEIHVTLYYYIMLGIISIVNESLATTLMLAVLSFFSRISDPRFGGTYMTLLNTVFNFGAAVSVPLALKLVNVMTFKNCSNDPQNRCSSLDLIKTCGENGGQCVTIVDGYYIECGICLIIGFVWYFSFKDTLEKLQTKNSSHWLVNFGHRNTENAEESFIAS